MSCEPEELVLDGIPALRWGEPGGRAVIGVHGQFSNKRDPIMAQCGDVIASRGDQLITFDLPTHGNRQDDKAFNPMEASPEVRTFAQLARSQSTEIGLLANSIGDYFSLCDTPAGTFERHAEGARNRRGGHGEDIDIGAQAFELLFLDKLF